MHYFIKIICCLNLTAIFFLPNALHASDWVLKSDGYALSRQLFDKTLKARGFNAAKLPSQQRQALLQELFIRESLLTQQDQVSASALVKLEEQLHDYRLGQLSRLTLDVLSAEGMPDYNERAKELYAVRKLDHYQQPLRLRVSILRKRLGQTVQQREDRLTALRDLLLQIQQGSLDFQQAVLQYSDDAKRTLTQGDSFWFQQGQQPALIFSAAQQLTATKPVSDVLVGEQYAYILKFIGRQEARQQSFAEVKGEIIQTLQAEYRAAQRKTLLAHLRERFQTEVIVHPDFQ